MVRKFYILRKKGGDRYRLEYKFYISMELIWNNLTSFQIKTLLNQENSRLLVKFDELEKKISLKTLENPQNRRAVFEGL
jgi:hypothetical protein